jgi:hypothetical protein
MEVTRRLADDDVAALDSMKMMRASYQALTR